VAPAVVPVVAPPVLSSMLPDPAAAAFEAARIAGEIVGDIESASGAAIVAAAAAGAAIEAARARSRAAGVEAEGGGDAGSSSGAGTPAAASAANMASAAIAAAAAAAAGHPGGAAAAGGADTAGAHDPVVTVRMHRERVLRALAEGATQTSGAGGAGTGATSGDLLGSGVYGRAAHPGSGSGSGEGVSGSGDEHGDEEELDPVALAAAAIQRLRQRASTDFAELRVHYHRHDIFVLLVAFVIIAGVGWLHGRMTTPPSVEFSERGLMFEHSKAWLAPEKLPPPPPRIAHDPTGQPPKADTAYHVAFTSSIDPSARIEVWIDKRPQWSNIVTNLDLERRTHWGELYMLDDSSVRSVEDQNWLRTAYRYAHVVDKGDAPRIDRAIEYATADREQIYVITLFGTPGELDRMEEEIIPTLRVPQKLRSALPLVPQTRSQAQRNYPSAVARAFDSTVMVVVADLIDGRLVARGGGTGVIVGADGSILTNFHVIHDKDGRLHDVFVIGRFSSLDRAPQLQCAGRPNRSKLQREVDLALIKCDTDLDGRTWTPGGSGVWPTLPEAKAAEVKMGQRLWVLGYPDVGGGGLTLSQGEVEGWTGPDGTTGRDFIKTDASITNGNSGGPVVDDQGKLVGLASAYRTRIVGGTVVESSHRGLVRPLATASDLLAIAATGWTPREGHTDVDLQPSAVEAPAEGVRIATHVIDHASEAPIADALVMVLRPGVSASAVDVNRLDDQVLAWGRSNMQGEVQLKQPVPVPGTYTVMVVARGYEALIGEGALHMDDKTPPAFDPWGEIRLRAR